MSGNRQLHVKVKTARGRKSSSTRWLQRQLNDPYVVQAKLDGYRSRAAYKIIEINEKFKIFKPGLKLIDLGAAPGGWSQIAKKYDCSTIAVDLLDMEPIPGVEFIKGDFTDDTILDEISQISDKFDLVVSDMAPSTCGHKQTDHLRIMHLCELALDFAINNLEEEGVFVAKTFQGGAATELLNTLKSNFSKVKHFKPKSSREDSSEMYVVALGFKG